MPTTNDLILVSPPPSYEEDGHFPWLEAARYLGVDQGDVESRQVAGQLYGSAVDLIQNACSIQLQEAEAVFRLDAFPSGRDEIQIPRPPVREILEFTYLDRNGATVTLTTEDYQFDGDSQPGRLLPAPGKTWPATQIGAINAIRIRLMCGHAANSPWPPSAQRLVFYLMGYWFENRLQAGSAPAGDPFFEQQLNLLRWI
ncbi:hypothetical protein SH661x_001074 [Planctomicrobium sp. SH661]|uniref:hypothetical protein n=1 Tax=Planctomicrobium sp. SH661 TaxID=3448124 RepID=UPI003F5B3AF9